MDGNRRLIWTAAAGLLLVAAVILGGVFLHLPPPGNVTPVPEGYVATLAFEHEGRSLSFGPFVGYYFRPVTEGEVRVVDFICRNERQFYTKDLRAGALLFEGQGVLTTLPDAGKSIPRKQRINPVFFSEAPEAWLATRPEPQPVYRHFHSCHTASGAVRTGYWLRHSAKATFTYNMGERVTENSPLHHEVTPGEDRAFATIIEFDQGPEFDAKGRQ